MKIFGLIFLIVIQCSCGWQNVARIMTPGERVDSARMAYNIQIREEVLGGNPPEIRISWNAHWVRIIRYLRSDMSPGNQELIAYIISERRKSQLPELSF